MSSNEKKISVSADSNGCLGCLGILVCIAILGVVYGLSQGLSVQGAATVAMEWVMLAVSGYLGIVAVILVVFIGVVLAVVFGAYFAQSRQRNHFKRDWRDW